MQRLYTHGREIVIDTVKVSLTLFRIMIPALIVVKLLESVGFIEMLATWISPLMQLMGLPDAAGLIWATTMLANIYTGMVVFFTLPGDIGWTQGQVTILGTLMLLAHSLPVELRIAQRAGCRLLTQLVLRIGGAIVLAMLLNQIYRYGGWLEQPVTRIWQPDVVDNSLSTWALTQLESCFWITVTIMVLLTLLKILRAIGIEQAISYLLQPVLKVLGISPKATTITIIGITLGLSYGGGLLIREAASGEVDAADIFAAVSLLGLCHSLIEDTLLIMLMGADLSGILWARLFFAVVVVAILARYQQKRSKGFSQRFLVNPPKAGF